MASPTWITKTADFQRLCFQLLDFEVSYRLVQGRVGGPPEKYHGDKGIDLSVEIIEPLKRIRLHDLRHTYATLQRKYGVQIEAISKVFGHASEIVALTIYDHWEGESRVAANTFDTILDNISKQRDGRKMLEEVAGVECRPYRSRTCDTLIKRYRRIVPSSNKKQL